MRAALPHENGFTLIELSIVLVIIGLIVCSASAAWTQQAANFFQCTQNADCAIVAANPCPGFVSSLNVHDIAAAEAYWKTLGPAMECKAAPSPRENPQDFTAYCETGSCRKRAK